MWQYKTDSSGRSAFPIGLTHTEGGIHISVVAAAKTCELLLFPSQEGKRNPDCKITTRNPDSKKTKNKKKTVAAGKATGPEVISAAVHEQPPQPAPSAAVQEQPPQPAPGAAVQEQPSQPALGAVVQEPSPQPAPGTAVQEPSPQPAPGAVVQEPSPQPAPGTAVQEPLPQPAPGAAVQEQPSQPAPSAAVQEPPPQPASSAAPPEQPLPPPRPAGSLPASSQASFQAEAEKHLAAQLAGAIRIPFPESGRTGNVWEMDLEADDLDNYTYAFAADGRIFADPWGRHFTGREVWGDPAQVHTIMKSSFKKEAPFDWQGDQPLGIPYEDSIIYRLHVRGFTRHTSARVPGRGTFEGIIAMIPYLQDLGITTLELMPVSEFQEVMVKERPEDLPYSLKTAMHSQRGISAPSGREGVSRDQEEMPDRQIGSPWGGQGCPEPSGRLNYWGYTSSLLMAPKASYAGPGKDPRLEFKKLVRALHQAGIELVVELYFDGTETWNQVLDCVRFWVREYHVDGIHLTGYSVPARFLAQDPYLAHTKLWAAYWEEEQLREEVRLRDMDTPQAVAGSRPTRRLAEYNDGFLIDMRRALKGDEGQMRALVDRFCRNPEGCGVINYLASTNGFTLADLVAYETKHNEANGENNRDGSDNNYSWNCGAEGPTRKKKILDLRRKQVRNALLLLFLSQGTPLLMAGDEFGNSQEGNNNAYCQDNDISWLNWKQTRAGQKLTEFVKYVISFRKAHSVFHKPHAPRLMDYLSCGHPDVSYHGLNTWYPEFEDFRRQIGIMYCGAYGRRADGTPDDYFYVACNFHWEPHEFALPNLPRGLAWHIAFDTGSQDTNGYYPAGSEPELENQKRYMVPSRTVMVLMGKQRNRQ